MHSILRGYRLFIGVLFGPTLLIVGVFIMAPVLAGLLISLTNASPLNRDLRFVGFDNYLYALSDPVFWEVIANTVVIVGISVLFSLVIAFALSLALNSRIAFSGIYRAGIFQVWIVPWITVAVVWSWIFNPEYGIINHLFVTLGILDQAINWFASDATAQAVIISGFAWRSIPLMMVISLAALQTIPDECLEAAKVDGCNSVQRLRFVIFPLVKNALLIIGLLQSIRLFQEITLPWIVTQGGPGNATTTLSIYAYKIAFQQWDFGLSAAVSTAWMIAVLVFSIFYIRLLTVRASQ